MLVMWPERGIIIPIRSYFVSSAIASVAASSPLLSSHHHTDAQPAHSPRSISPQTGITSSTRPVSDQGRALLGLVSEHQRWALRMMFGLWSAQEAAGPSEVRLIYIDIDSLHF